MPVLYLIGVSSTAMPHAVLIAAIFVPYVALMIGLGCYIARPARSEERDDAERERDAAEMRLAA